ncbi:MAG: hypothetical protein ACOX2O_02025 [Bdellovibrionota bacterium]
MGRVLSILVILLSLTACESYHLFCASQSLGPEQTYHFQALNSSTTERSKDQAGILICESFPQGMGGFSLSCRRAG